MSPLMPPREKPLLVYDGDCGFCRRRVARWQRLTGDRVEYLPYQEVADQFPGIPRERFEASVQLVEPNGRVTSGAEAVFRTLSFAPYFEWPLWLYRKIPGLAPLAEWCYRFVARHRAGLSPSQPCATGHPMIPCGHLVTSRIFLKALGSIGGIAFASLWTQVVGLIGKNGISPAADFLQAVSQRMGPERFLLFPTLCWLNPSDGFLLFLCAAGVFLSVLLVLGWVATPVLVLLWAFYLSLCVAGQQFLSFQWDILLVEMSFLAIFLVPPSIVPARSGQPPPKTAVWLFRWLLFRLLFLSAVVKWGSGDPAWRNLTALRYHYETQPLPTWIGWYAHQLPLWFHRVSAGCMFAIEGIVPFFIFGPRTLRFAACGVLVGFQLLILATGNYCFFNLLTMALCLFLLDDAVWPPRSLGHEPHEGAEPRRHWPRWVIIPLAALILMIGTVQISAALGGLIPWPKAIVELVDSAAPFRTVNSYGLFAVMTTRRPEIVVEGSLDGITWRAYEFKYKPGDLKRRPSFAAPHQPRLDWQMWFAALSSYRENPWFISFCERLLRGTPQVLALLKENPFPAAPPRIIRAALYDYHFTDLPTRRSKGTWWRRQLKGFYCPALELRQD